MATDLFAVASGLDPAAIASAIPPACRRPVQPPPLPTRDGDDAVVDAGPWTPRTPVRHLVPSLSVLADRRYAFRFEASARRGGAWSSWSAAAAIGDATFPPLDGDGALEPAVDLWTAREPVEAIRLRLRLRADDPLALLRAPWLVTLSAWDGAPPAAPRATGVRTLGVPAVSQMADGGAVASRVCSPASVAMVLRYWGGGAEVAALAEEMFHPALDLYGVWPAAIRAAARRGVLGYLLRFPDWGAAAWCLERGFPVIASIRYEAGELTGAAIAATAGHLVVLTGYDGDSVLVNDPAAADAAGVPRRYALAELARVWLERSGVGYVLFAPSAV